MSELVYVSLAQLTCAETDRIASRQLDDDGYFFRNLVQAEVLRE